MVNPENLDLAERRRFISILNIFMRRESLSYYLHKEGNLPDEIWDSRVRGLTGIFNQPGMRFFLDAIGDALPTEYREFLEATISGDTTMTETGKKLFEGLEEPRNKPSVGET